MNKIIIVSCFLLCSVFSWGFNHPTNGFNLKGEIQGYGNGRIVIIHSLPRQKIEDTLMVVNDHFEYKGIVKSPYLVFFRILGNEVNSVH